MTIYLCHIICTCCHQLLFQKTVRTFHISDYNVCSEVVEKHLHHHFIMRHSRQHDMSNNTENHTNGLPKVSAEYIACKVQCPDEYICLWKTPKVPNQAWANGLHLDVIPQDLCNVFPLECRLTAQRIPFITIIILKRYGSHYKINGPPVNVPASLDQVIDILPRMSNQLQLHPLKLLCKLEYKCCIIFSYQLTAIQVIT